MVGGAPSPASTLVPARELDGQSASDVGLHVTGFGLWIRHVGRLEHERLLRSGHVAGLLPLGRSALRRLAGLSCGGWLRRRARNALRRSGLALLYGLSVLDGLGRGLLPYRFRGRLLRRHGLPSRGRCRWNGLSRRFCWRCLGRPHLSFGNRIGVRRGKVRGRYRGLGRRGRHGLLALGHKRSALHGGLAEHGRCSRGCRSLRRDRASRRLLRVGRRGFSRNVCHGRSRRWLHGLRGSRGWCVSRCVAG